MAAMAARDEVTRGSIAAAEKIIRPHIRKTPVLEADGGDFGLDGVRLVLKLEFCQHAGSFKARGAFANLLLSTIPKAGVAAASGGNHGAAVAYAAMRLGIPAKIFVPEISSPAKIDRIRSYKADLVIGGARYADALEACEVYAAETGALNVHAYDSTLTMRGAGTLALELEDEAPGLDLLLVAVGGGGLIGGVAAFLDGRTKLIGVEPEQAPKLARALAAGKPVDAPVGGVAADSLGAKKIGATAWPIIKARVADAALVFDAAIVSAQKTLWETLRLVAEPGGAAAFAALLSGAVRPDKGARVGVVLSGGNTSAVNFHR